MSGDVRIGRKGLTEVLGKGYYLVNMHYRQFEVKETNG